MAAPALRGFQQAESTSNASNIVLASLLGIALLLVTAAAISPAYVPWPRAAAGLYAHRLDLMMLGFGAAGIAFFAFGLQLLGP